VLVGGVALVMGVLFLSGNSSLGFGSFDRQSGPDGSAELAVSDSIESIKDQDADQDGLSDLEERLYHTNPDNPDTDGDGFSDADEVANGYDPASSLQAGTGDSLTSEGTSANLLALLGSSGGSEVSGLGGLGGLSDDQTSVLGSQVLPDGGTVAELEVDQVLNNGSRPLPSVAADSVRTTSDSSGDREEAYFREIVGVASEFDPFGPGYSIKRYLDDIESGNRDLFERMKLSAESILKRLQGMEVPESMLDEHLHALGILLAANEELQQVLDTKVSADATLSLLGRSFFIIGEIRGFLQEIISELQT